MVAYVFTVHFAYLDPSTGSIVIQAIVGALAGVSLFGRRVIGNAVRKLKALFVRPKAGDVPAPKTNEQKAKDTDRS